MQNKNYQALISPEVVWNVENSTEFFGELIAQPLESGFGTTLGNAMRRVMLSAVEGAAVTAVIVSGVNNEFATLPGVVEDVMQIILNIKKIIIKNNSGLPGKMTVQKSGAGRILAGDIQTDSHLLIINPDLVIANLSFDGHLEIEFFVEMGRGYQFAKWHNDVKLQPDGKIFIDAMFSPVVRVSYNVEKTRVGDSIDYDKLIMGIETNGTITPQEVVNYSVSVLANQLSFFSALEPIDFNNQDEQGDDEEVSKSESVTNSSVNSLVKEGVPVDLFLKPIQELELSVRANNCLLNYGVARVIDLVNLTSDDILRIKNFGRKSLKEVTEVLSAFGLRLKMNIKESDLKKALKDQVSIKI